MRLNKERIKKIMKDYNNFNIVYFNKKSKRAYDCYYIDNNELIRINHSDVIKWKYTILYLLKIVSLSQRIQANCCLY